MSISNWQDIIGHEQITAELKSLTAEKKLPHALLFAGMKGIGKKAAADVLAKTLLCSSSCADDGCISCRAFDNKNHPDYYYLEPEGKSVKMIKIEQIRKMQEGISLAPYMSDKRVVVIDGAERMNEAAANSLLKTLEDPIGQVYFILIAENKDMLLPTILSRCMKLYFAPLSFDEVTQILIHRHDIEPAQAKIAAGLSGGSAGKALEFLEDGALRVRSMAAQFFFASFDSAELDARRIWSLSDELGGMERKDAERWALCLRMLLRDLLLLESDVNSDSKLLYNCDMKERLSDLKGRSCAGALFAKLNLADDFAKRLNSNADVKLALQKLMLQWKKI